jgi:hypothetical protein
MPILALIVTDEHNLDALMLALPGGTTYTTLELTDAEWAKPPLRLVSEYLVEIAARSQQAWTQQQAHP